MLLQNARAASMIREAGACPFHLKAAVMLFGEERTERNGFYELWWQAPNVYREEFRCAGYTETRIVNVDRWWHHRSLDYVPSRVSQVFRLFEFPKDWQKGLKDAQDIRVKKPDGEDRIRIAVSRKSGSEMEYLLDAASGVVTSVESPNSKSLYGNWILFHGKRVPQIYKEMEREDVAVKARVQDLADVEDHDPALFALPEDASTWPWCSDLETPKPEKEVKPAYPRAMLAGGMQGKVELFLVLNETGEVKDAQVARTAGKKFDEAALKAVRQWKFRPARCGETPVPAEHRVTIFFMMR